MSKRPSASAFLEPNLLFLIFAGVSLGTVLIAQPFRMALLWLTLLILSLLYRSRQPVDVGFDLARVGRGALFGLVIAVPMFAFLAGPLRVFMERLYATKDAMSLFYQVCFVAAPVEGYFFRGIVQPRMGSSAGIALYAVTALLFFLPHVPILASFIAFVAMGVLGIIYSYVREHYGLAASVACHVVIGFIVQVLPSLVETVRVMLA